MRPLDTVLVSGKNVAMKLNQLRNVGAIAEHGSLRGAARALGLAQPALTRSVQELEHELGTPLFERRKRGMTLTRAGEAFVRRANAILSDVRRAREEVEQISGSIKERWSRGYRLPPISRCCHARCHESVGAIPPCAFV